MKKIYISVDLEGIGGVVSTAQTGVQGNDLYREARELMAGEVNAAIQGINNAGGLAVIGDSHGSMLNIPICLLKGNFLLACGNDKELSMMGGIDETYTGVIFLGYHSKFGTAFSIMDHTYSPSTVYSIKINGHESGEAEINAGVAGFYNVPILMVSGDDTTIKQLKGIFPSSEMVIVKESLGRFSALCKPVDIVRQVILEACENVTKNPEKYASNFKFETPVKVEIVWNSSAMAEIATYVPGVDKTSDRITVYETEDYIKAFKLFKILRILANSVADPDYV